MVNSNVNHNSNTSAQSHLFSKKRQSHMLQTSKPPEIPGFNSALNNSVY